MLIDRIKGQIDELITDDGEPFEDAIFLIQHTLDRALSPAARGGMGVFEAEILEQIKELVP